MKETYYFAHDYNAIQDPKMMSLLCGCGLSGIGLYWIIIEILHQQKNNKISYQAYCDYIDFYGKIDGDNEHVLNKIRQMLISVGLFVKENEEIYSNRVLENINQRKIISEKRSFAGKKSGEIRRNINKKDNKRTSVEHVLNKNEHKKKKEKKRNIINNSDKSPINKTEIKGTFKEYGILKEGKNNLKEIKPITSLYEQFGIKKNIRKVEKWQDSASIVVKEMNVPEEKISSVFKCFKDNEREAMFALRDCKELGKMNVFYFLKVYSEIVKKNKKK